MKDKLDCMRRYGADLEMATRDLETAAHLMEAERDLHQAESQLEHANYKLLEELVDAQVATAKCLAAMSHALHHHLCAHHGVAL